MSGFLIPLHANVVPRVMIKATILKYKRQEDLLFKTVSNLQDYPKRFTRYSFQTCSVERRLGFSGKHLKTVRIQRSTTIYSDILIHTAG